MWTKCRRHGHIPLGSAPNLPITNQDIAMNPLSIALAALAASIGANVLTILRISSLRKACQPITYITDDSHYSTLWTAYPELTHYVTDSFDTISSRFRSSAGYEDSDHPTQLPLHLPYVSLKIEDTEQFAISTPKAFADWRSTDYFPRANGFVRLGPHSKFKLLVR